jgi:hypothetical protein
MQIFCAGRWHEKVKAVLALTSILTKEARPKRKIFTETNERFGRAVFI